MNVNVSRRAALIGSAALLAGALTSPTTALAGKRMVFGGGPAGGTFQIVANAIQTYDPVKASEDYTVKAQSSAGSVENLRKVNRGKMQFAVVYSGHVYLGREGRMKNDDRRYEDVLAVSYLYGAPAQLVVRKGSGIGSVKDLAGRKVGVGNAGSGAFANCELFFSHLGVWDRIERNAMGYNDAAGEGRALKPGLQVPETTVTRPREAPQGGHGGPFRLHGNARGTTVATSGEWRCCKAPRSSHSGEATGAACSRS